jgi:CubicO group peptidase (beta-lactamase class C family)
VHGFPGYPRDAEAPSLVGVLEGEGNTPPVRASTIPGLQFSYSGGGYCVLQQLLIDVTGKPFPELARELVLEPFGMVDSTYEQPLPEHLHQLASSGHRQGGAPVVGRWHVYPEMAAAGLWTTPTDLARFLIAIQEAKAGIAGALLPRELTEEVLTPQAPNMSYGLGLKVEGEGRTLLFGHGGDDQGFNAWANAYAELGLGAVVMTNSDVGWMLFDPVRGAIARAYEWPESELRHPELRAARLEPGAYAGAYELPDGDVLLIEPGATGLVLVPPGQPPIELYPIGGDDWVARTVRAKVVFVRDEAGAPERIVLSQDADYVQDVEARRRG